MHGPSSGLRTRGNRLATSNAKTIYQANSQHADGRRPANTATRSSASTGALLIRIQQYERLIKAIVAHHDISGPAHALEAIRAARIDDASTKTLGALVGQLVGSYVTTEAASDNEKEAELPDNAVSFRFRTQLSLSVEDYIRTQDELRELVSLRNMLVHHFIDRHDLWTTEGCRSAQEALDSAYARIDQHYEQLRGWAEHMEQARQLAAEFVQSDAFRDFVINGIAPDGSVDWAGAGIVRVLREAARELSVEGWTPVHNAGRWIQERYPTQPSMAAPVGARFCMNRVYSNFATARWMDYVLPGTEPRKHRRIVSALRVRPIPRG